MPAAPYGCCVTEPPTVSKRRGVGQPLSTSQLQQQHLPPCCLPCTSITPPALYHMPATSTILTAPQPPCFRRERQRGPHHGCQQPPAPAPLRVRGAAGRTPARCLRPPTPLRVRGAPTVRGPPARLRPPILLRSAPAVRGGPARHVPPARLPPALWVLLLGCTPCLAPCTMQCLGASHCAVHCALCACLRRFWLPCCAVVGLPAAVGSCRVSSPAAWIFVLQPCTRLRAASTPRVLA